MEVFSVRISLLFLSKFEDGPQRLISSTLSTGDKGRNAQMGILFSEFEWQRRRDIFLASKEGSILFLGNLDTSRAKQAP
jgi:hypothetical protein